MYIIVENVGVSYKCINFIQQGCLKSIKSDWSSLQLLKKYIFQINAAFFFLHLVIITILKTMHRSFHK